VQYCYACIHKIYGEVIKQKKATDLICKVNCDFNWYIFRTLLSTKSISTPINGYVSYDCILKHRTYMWLCCHGWMEVGFVST
jgi:hypothetical protein